MSSDEEKQKKKKDDDDDDNKNPTSTNAFESVKNNDTPANRKLYFLFNCFCCNTLLNLN